MRELVTVVIPVFQQEWTSFEQMLFKRTAEVLDGFSFIFVAQEKDRRLESLSVEMPESRVYRFEDRFFKSEAAFSELLLSPGFYDMFGWSKYILLTGPGTFLVRNELTYWCKQGYDYIAGADGLFSLREIDRFHRLTKKKAGAIHRLISGNGGNDPDRHFWGKQAAGFWPALQSPTETVNRYFSLSAGTLTRLPTPTIPFAITGLQQENPAHQRVLQSLIH